ncbi:MAG: rhomboid family intramembrane serine protease [Bdellovibrionaceae bacterium]|nr:rhomboid family intramembrane serine protease [Pseudobdellovibrionaceae bacterium]
MSDNMLPRQIRIRDFESARTPKALAMPIIIFLNILVFAAWFYTQLNREGLAFMAKNFLVSWDHLEQGYYWVLLTSVFSHNMFWHIFLNMYIFIGFGSVMEATLGTTRFVFFYLLAGIISSLSHVVVSAYILDKPELPALGASGAIAGVILLFSLMYPKQKIVLLGLIPLPAIFGALIFVGLDLWGLSAQAHGGGLPIGHGAHLGGAFTGILFYYLYIRPTHFKRLRGL